MASGGGSSGTGGGRLRGNSLSSDRSLMSCDSLVSSEEAASDDLRSILERGFVSS